MIPWMSYESRRASALLSSAVADDWWHRCQLSQQADPKDQRCYVGGAGLSESGVRQEDVHLTWFMTHQLDTGALSVEDCFH